MRYHIVNPAAGKGKAQSMVSAQKDDIIHVTTSVGDARKYVASVCEKDDEPYFVVYGGDGTINEVVCGIMTANAGGRAIFSVVACGSGDDFPRSFTEKGVYTIDVMQLGVRWAVNMLNIGFDCSVVDKVTRYQHLPFVTGSFAYILGIVDCLIRDMGEPFRVIMEREDGKILTYDAGEYLLCTVANGAYCGGGFHSNPIVSLNDGLLDVLIVKKVTRRRFLNLVADYKAGSHIDRETGQPIEKFADIMDYVKCRSVKLENMSMICIDGENRAISSTEVRVLKNAIRYEKL